jgi:hypothetical protein
LAQGLSFRETFGSEADGDLDDLRRIFLVKAFQRRQAALLVHLMAAGYESEALVKLTLCELATLKFDQAGAQLVGRYLERRPVVDAALPEACAFVDADGDALQAETLPTYVRLLRRVDVNAEFNSALCRGLLHARFDTETPITPRRAAEPPKISAQQM